MAEYIECRNCDSPNCEGCNILELTKMLHDGKFDCLMDDSHSVNQFADVAPVRHGGWVTLTECANEGAYCSVCRKKVYKVWYASCNKVNKVRSDYCPNCGARMDLEEKQL